MLFYSCIVILCMDCVVKCFEMTLDVNWIISTTPGGLGRKAAGGANSSSDANKSMKTTQWSETIKMSNNRWNVTSSCRSPHRAEVSVSSLETLHGRQDLFTCSTFTAQLRGRTLICDILIFNQVFFIILNVKSACGHALVHQVHQPHSVGRKNVNHLEVSSVGTCFSGTWTLKHFLLLTSGVGNISWEASN